MPAIMAHMPNRWTTLIQAQIHSNMQELLPALKNWHAFFDFCNMQWTGKQAPFHSLNFFSLSLVVLQVVAMSQKSPRPVKKNSYSEGTQCQEWHMVTTHTLGNRSRAYTFVRSNAHHNIKGYPFIQMRELTIKGHHPREVFPWGQQLWPILWRQKR